MAISMGKGCIEAIYGLMGWKGLKVNIVFLKHQCVLNLELELSEANMYSLQLKRLSSGMVSLLAILQQRITRLLVLYVGNTILLPAA